MIFKTIELKFSDHVLLCHVEASGPKEYITVSRNLSPKVTLSLPATLWLVVAPTDSCALFCYTLLQSYCINFV